MWVFINPHAVGLWYPQTPVSVFQDGTWQTICYFGREDQDVGEIFDIGVILVTMDEAKKLAEEVKGGDIKSRQLFDKIYAQISVKRK